MEKINNLEMKKINKHLLLFTISCNRYSRAELARITGLTRAGVSIIIDELLKEGYVLDDEKDNISLGAGRRSTKLIINKDFGHIAGIKITRYHYYIGLLDFSGDPIATFTRAFDKDIEAATILAEIIEKLKTLMADNNITTLLGIGITAPGPLSPITGTILTPPNFKKWHHLQIVNFFKEEFACPIYLEKSASALALVERNRGIGRTSDSFAMLLIDSGIGSAIIKDKELYKGTSEIGVELGHVSIDCFGERCSCGNYGCFEMYASIPNFMDYVHRVKPKVASFDDLVNLAKDGDSKAISLLDRELRYIVSLVVSAVNAFDITTFVLHGAITKQAKYLLPIIEKEVNKLVMPRQLTAVKIVEFCLDKDIEVIASGSLVLEKLDILPYNKVQM